MFKIASENSCRGFDHKTEAGPCNEPQTALIFSGFILYLKRENFSYNKQLRPSNGSEDIGSNVKNTIFAKFLKIRELQR